MSFLHLLFVERMERVMDGQRGGTDMAVGAQKTGFEHAGMIFKGSGHVFIRREG